MRISFIFLLFLSFFRFASAQDKPLSIELAFGPTGANHFFYGKEGLFHLKNSSPILSYDAGMRIHYSFSDKWDFGAGLSYSRKGYLNKITLRNSGGTTLLEEKSIKDAFSYLEVPVIARYYFLEESGVRYYGQIGMAGSFYLLERSLYRMDFEGEGPVSFIRKTYRSNVTRPVNLGVHLGVGFRYPLMGALQFGLEPFFSSHIFPLEGEGTDLRKINVKQWLYSYGINFVLRW